MEYDMDGLDKIINDATPKLLPKLKLDPMMLSKLRQYEVLTDSLEDELMTVGLSGNTKNKMFLDDLKLGPIERFLHFCRIMKEGGQPHIVDFLKVNMDIIYAQLGMEPEKAQPRSTEGTAVPPPWDKRHPKAETYLEEDEDLFKKVKNATEMLKRLVRPKDLWGNLLRYDVINDSEVDQCKAGKTTGEHVEEALQILRKAEVWKTHAFFRSLAHMEQASLIDRVLGEGHKKLYMKNLK